MRPKWLDPPIFELAVVLGFSLATVAMAYQEYVNSGQVAATPENWVPAGDARTGLSVADKDHNLPTNLKLVQLKPMYSMHCILWNVKIIEHQARISLLTPLLCLTWAIEHWTVEDCHLVRYVMYLCLSDKLLNVEIAWGYRFSLSAGCCTKLLLVRVFFLISQELQWNINFSVAWHTQILLQTSSTVLWCPCFLLVWVCSNNITTIFHMSKFK